MTALVIVLLVALYCLGIFLVLRVVGANRRDPERELERWVREALREVEEQGRECTRFECDARERGEGRPCCDAE